VVRIYCTIGTDESPTALHAVEKKMYVYNLCINL